MRLILGSSSICRRDLFKRHFSEFYTSDAASFRSPDIDEKSIRDADADALVRKIAEAKLDRLLLVEQFTPDVVVVACDQVVVAERDIREKPVDEEEARAFLKSYQRGTSACCVNGLAVHAVGSGRRSVSSERSSVTFSAFPDSVLDALISSGAPFLSAGAFSIDHLAKYVTELTGSHSSIEGLPTTKIRQMVAEVSGGDSAAAAPRRIGHAQLLLFDMDGLLLDTGDLYTKAQQKLLDPFGLTLTWEVKAKMIGRKALDAVRVMIDFYAPVLEHMDVAKFLHDRDVLLEEMFPTCELMAGVERLLTHMHRHAVPMAVATSSTDRNFKLKTTKHKELFDRVFSHIVTGDMISASKPAPEIFERAAAAFPRAAAAAAPPPHNCLVFEDAPVGVEAARAANMNVVFVPHQDLKVETNLASQTLRSLLEFLPEEWGLPPFN